MPVVGKTPAQISKRADYFRAMLDVQASSRVLKGLGVQYHPAMPSILAHCYFAVSEAYKRKFLYPGKGTDPTKQAAFTCATIAYLRPLHAPSETVQREEYIYMNEMLGMRCACSIVAHPVHTRGFDEQRRIYHMLRRVALPSVRPILDESYANNGELKSDFEITLTTEEECELKNLISLFVVYKDLKIYAAVAAPAAGLEIGGDGD